MVSHRDLSQHQNPIVNQASDLYAATPHHHHAIYFPTFLHTIIIAVATPSFPAQKPHATKRNQGEERMVQREIVEINLFLPEYKLIWLNHRRHRAMLGKQGVKS